MRCLLLPITPRYILLSMALAGTGVLMALAWHNPGQIAYLAIPLAFFGFFAAVGLRDFF